MQAKSANPLERQRQFEPALIQALVARTRAEQGLSPTITDPAVLARLAVLCRPSVAGRAGGER